jgi:hypothetical protein
MAIARASTKHSIFLITFASSPLIEGTVNTVPFLAGYFHAKYLTVSQEFAKNTPMAKIHALLLPFLPNMSLQNKALLPYDEKSNVLKPPS